MPRHGIIVPDNLSVSGIAAPYSMADAMAGHRVSGPDTQPLAVDLEGDLDLDSELDLRTLDHTSDLHGYTQRPKPSRLTLRLPLDYTSDLPPEADPMSASSVIRRRLFGGRRRCRRAGLPLPIDCTTTFSDR
jgi:hypothetical protein